MLGSAGLPLLPLELACWAVNAFSDLEMLICFILGKYLNYLRANDTPACNWLAFLCWSSDGWPESGGQTSKGLEGEFMPAHKVQLLMGSLSKHIKCSGAGIWTVNLSGLGSSSSAGRVVPVSSRAGVP